MNIKACLSKNTDDWKTPTDLYSYLMNLGYIDTFKYKSNENEFNNNYTNQKLFINPPFSKMKEVSKWVIKQLNNNNQIILLIPARTDTKYFHELLKYSPIIYFIKGRLHYNDSNSAPFPTIALYFDKYNIIPLPFYYYGSLEEFKEYIKRANYE